VKASGDEQAESSEKKKPEDQSRNSHARRSMMLALKLGEID
jgi:hypothetical protein